MLTGMDLEVLSRDESLRLLASVPVGRIVYTSGALPAVQPVNFVLDDGAIVIRTGAGSKLTAALRNGVVAFEADVIDADTRSGWSVTITGRVREVTEATEVARLRDVVRPWAPGAKGHILKIATEVVTGRRISAGRS